MTTWLFDQPTDHRDPGDVLDITLRFEGDVTVCVLAGPLCAYTAPALDAWLAQLLDNGRHRLIVDGRALSSLSVDGVEVLEAHARRFGEAGGHLRVRGTSATSQRVLRLCTAAHLLDEHLPDD